MIILRLAGLFLFLGASLSWSQCNKIVLNPITGLFDCTGGSGGGTGNGVVSTTFSSQTSVTLTHNAGISGSGNVPWTCVQTGTGAPLIPATVTFTTNAVTFTFSPAESGTCTAGTGGTGLTVGTGTAGTLSVFTGSSQIGDSLVSQSGSVVTVNGSIVATSAKSLGAAATPWQSLYLYGSGTFGTHSMQLTGAPTGNRVLTLPDATTTLAGGGSNLTTVGAVPYVSASGILNQDASNLFWDATNHRLGVDTASPVTELQVSSTSTSSPRGIMSAQFNTGTDGARFHGRKARGTETAPTIVVSGDNLMRLVGSGYDGSNYLEMGSIILGTEGTIASTRIPTNVQFWTATDATPSVLTEAMRINSAQNVGIGTGATITAGLHVAKNGALSSGNGPAIKGDGTWITGGSATTTKPYLLIEPSGTTSTGWSTSGTGIGVNAASGFAGNLLALQVAGVSKLNLSAGGNLIVANLLSAPFYGGTTDGVVRLSNNAASGFDRLQFGGTTSSFPSWQRSSAGLIARLADDSADTWVRASQFRSTLTTPASAAATCVAGTFVADANYMYFCTATDTWKRVAIATW